MYLRIRNFKALLKENVWRYQSIIFYKLSMPSNNWNNEDVKWGGSAECQIEVAMGKKQAMLDIFLHV